MTRITQPLRVILVGLGPMGLGWYLKHLPPLVNDGAIEVVALVDCDASALARARTASPLPRKCIYNDLEHALERSQAHCAFVATNPEAHEVVVRRCVDEGLHVLCEKPLSGRTSTALRLAALARSRGCRLGMMMNHRYESDKAELLASVSAGSSGAIDYIVMRITGDYRQRDAWSHRLYSVQHPVLSDAIIHHLHLASAITGSRIDEVYANDWSPSWSEFDGHAQAIVVARTLAGHRVLYEAGMCNAIPLSDWKHEYIRVELRNATIELDSRRLSVWTRTRPCPPRQPRPVPTRYSEIPSSTSTGHTAAIGDFVAWCRGGPPILSHGRHLVWDVAAAEAAVFSAQRGVPVRSSQLVKMAVIDAGADYADWR